LTTADVLALLDSDVERARAAWRDYVADRASATSPWDRLRSGHYLGSEGFLRGLRQHIDGRSLDQVPSAMADPARPTAEQILEAVAGAAGCSRAVVLDRRRAPEPFRAGIYLLRRAGNVPLRDVAAMAAVSPGRISQI